MNEAASQAEANKKDKADREQALTDAYRLRASNWAANVIQNAYRAYQALKRARQYAYLVYSKHFDPVLRSYYYVEKKSKKAQWHKPKILGGFGLVVLVWVWYMCMKGC